MKTIEVVYTFIYVLLFIIFVEAIRPYGSLWGAHGFAMVVIPVGSLISISFLPWGIYLLFQARKRKAEKKGRKKGSNPSLTLSHGHVFTRTIAHRIS